MAAESEPRKTLERAHAAVARIGGQLSLILEHGSVSAGRVDELIAGLEAGLEDLKKFADHLRRRK